ncbi:PRD domain-containing protein [Bacillus tuaregi]|uniref:PRD domain-containing protein n=1 Tax=Bacillus tuaregi TaxID=1816695 RepID=UPI0008F94269|nr:PRD domain-containing protein [Bacillus tuaregi]
MKIKKILNNNAVVISDQNEEKIAIGTGIAFQKGKNDLVNPRKIEKLFVLKENERFQQMLKQIPAAHFTISEEIIDHAERFLGTKLNGHIHIALTDHVSFAIERVKDGVNFTNKLFNEIKLLYKPEFEIGLWALKHIEEKMGVKMPVDEAAYIAIHIHTAKIQGSNMKQTLRQTAILSHIIQTIKEFMQLKVDEEELSYQRLITHLRFAVTRIGQFNTNPMDEEMLRMIKAKFPISYKCALKVADNLAHQYSICLPEHELGYLTIHIERLQKSE